MYIHVDIYIQVPTITTIQQGTREILGCNYLVIAGRMTARKKKRQEERKKYNNS